MTKTQNWPFNTILIYKFVIVIYFMIMDDIITILTEVGF